MLTMFVGYDPREAAAYHVFCQSVIAHASVPVAFVPMSEKMLHVDGQQDGSNAFIYSRYLVPHLMGHWDWAIFADGDMVCQRDIAELWALRDERYAVQVVQHDYQTKAATKYRGSPMECPNTSYPRKNWSSLVLWNCAHALNRALTPERVATAGGPYLHRFAWLPDEAIGALPKEWNWLVGEYPPQPAALLHYTLGVPGFHAYADGEQAQAWHAALIDANHVYGENAHEMMERAYGRSKLA